MTIINFTAEYDILTNESSPTAGQDVGTEPLIGYVHFVPVFVDSKPIMAKDYLPRPAGLRPRSFSGYIDTDGRLRPERGSVEVGIRLWANDPVFELARPLVYKVTFDLSTPAGEKVRISEGYLPAPDEDITVNLAEVMEATGYSNVSTPPTFYTLDAASPLGVDIATSITQSAARAVLGAGSAGDAVFVASTAELARTAIGAVSSSDVAAEIASSATVAGAVEDAIDDAMADAGIVYGDPLVGDPELSFALTDSASRRSDLELDLDGKFTDRVIESIGDRLGLSGSAVIPEIADDGRVFLADVDSGDRTLLGTVSGASSPTLLDSTAVRVETATGPQWVSTVYSTPRPVFPSTDIACWGDSLTYSTNPGPSQANPTYPQTVAADLGVAVYNGGIGGNCSADIATRQGGLQPLCTLTGGQIPSGSTSPIVLTAISPTTGWRITANTAFAGTLAGVAGTLTNNVSGGNFTFTPASPPAVTVSVPAGTPFIASEGASMRDRINVIWSGHNNAPQATAVADVSRDVASMVAWLTPYTKRYLIVSVTWESKVVNDAINAPLAATYGDRYVDLNGWLISDGLDAVGLTPTAGDLADIAAGEVPRSLRHDGTHFTQACTTAIGHYIADQITARNWV